MRIERVKNFITQAECDTLSAWVDEGVQKRWLDVGTASVNALPYPRSKRVTSRLYGARYENPALALEIFDRIRAYCGLSNYPLIAGHGRDGIVTSCTFPGGDVYPHMDPKSKDGLSTLRCNIVTRAADAGCVLYVGGQVVAVEAGELHCYLASDYEHFVTPVKGNTSRVIWMFGAHVPKEEWESGHIKVGA